jgi:GTPase
VFVDEVEITVQAGNGGKGLVSFRREKYVPKGGPNGGNGGKGGDVIIVASTQLHTLLDHRYRREYRAGDGASGGTALKSGRAGADQIIAVPTGTLVRDTSTGEIIADLVENAQRCVVAKGGIGGRGNAEFRTATNQTPRRAEAGRPGAVRTLQLELKLIADVGLVGFPNAGKSTLISRISAAKPKIADYPFTTLEPNLGIVQYREFESFTVADIPGLIEGAHTGKGLGIQFLRHIERTRVLLLLIDALSDDFARDMDILRGELAAYSAQLARKHCFLAVSKSDIADDDCLDRIKELEKTISSDIIIFSSVTGHNLEVLKDRMWREIQADTKSSDTVDDEEAWTP